MTTVLDTIDKGTAYLEKKGIDDARRNMQLLVTHEIGCSRVELYMQFDRPMTEEELIPLRGKLKPSPAIRTQEHGNDAFEYAQYDVALQVSRKVGA